MLRQRLASHRPQDALRPRAQRLWQGGFAQHEAPAHHHFGGAVRVVLEARLQRGDGVGGRPAGSAPGELLEAPPRQPVPPGPIRRDLRRFRVGLPRALRVARVETAVALLQPELADLQPVRELRRELARVRIVRRGGCQKAAPQRQTPAVMQDDEQPEVVSIAPRQRLELADLGGRLVPGTAVDQKLDAVSSRESDELVPSRRRGDGEALRQRRFAARGVLRVVERGREVEQEPGALPGIVARRGQRLPESQDRTGVLAAVQKPARLLRQELRRERVIAAPQRERADGFVRGLLLADTTAQGLDPRPHEGRRHPLRGGEVPTGVVGFLEKRGRGLEASLSRRTDRAEPQGSDRLGGGRIRMRPPPRRRAASRLGSGVQDRGQLGQPQSEQAPLRGGGLGGPAGAPAATARRRAAHPRLPARPRSPRARAPSLRRSARRDARRAGTRLRARGPGTRRSRISPARSRPALPRRSAAARCASRDPRARSNHPAPAAPGRDSVGATPPATARRPWGPRRSAPTRRGSEFSGRRRPRSPRRRAQRAPRSARRSEPTRQSFRKGPKVPAASPPATSAVEARPESARAPRDRAGRGPPTRTRGARAGPSPPARHRSTRRARCSTPPALAGAGSRRPASRTVGAEPQRPTGVRDEARIETARRPPAARRPRLREQRRAPRASGARRREPRLRSRAVAERALGRAPGNARKAPASQYSGRFHLASGGPEPLEQLSPPPRCVTRRPRAKRQAGTAAAPRRPTCGPRRIRPTRPRAACASARVGAVPITHLAPRALEVLARQREAVRGEERRRRRALQQEQAAVLARAEASRTRPRPPRAGGARRRARLRLVARGRSPAEASRARASRSSHPARATPAESAKHSASARHTLYCREVSDAGRGPRSTFEVARRSTGTTSTRSAGFSTRSPGSVQGEDRGRHGHAVIADVGSRADARPRPRPAR